MNIFPANFALNRFTVIHYNSWYSKAYVFSFGAISKMEDEKQLFRHILLFYYRKGKNVCKNRSVWRRCIDRTPMPKLVCKISFWQFQSSGYTNQDSKITWTSFFPASIKNFMSVVSISCPEDGKMYYIKIENT